MSVLKSVRLTQAMLFSLAVFALTPTAEARPAEAALVQQMKKTAEKGDYAQFSKLMAQLPSDSIFAPYADAWQFRLLQGNEKREDGRPGLWRSQEVQYLLQKHDSAWPLEEIRREWLGQMAFNGEWSQYPEQRAKLKYRADQTVECADLWYASTKGPVLTSDIQKVLTSPKGLPRVCRGLIRHSQQIGLLKESDLNLRVFSLIGNNQAGLVPRFVDEMRGTSWAEGVQTATLDGAIDRPERFLGSVDSAAGKDLTVGAALAKLSMSDYEAAADRLKTLEKQLKSDTRHWLWAHIGYRAALQWDRNALNYFKQGSPEVMSQDQREWKVRSALLIEDWPQVGRAIDELPEKLANEDAWKYWRGRSRAAAGQIDQARALWASMASPFNFYGKLATEELGATISAPARPKPLSQAEIDEANRNPGLKRAMALYDAGLTKEGFWEFNLAVAQMNDRQLLAAANWAKQNELLDRAIAAADRTQAEHDLSLRYLTPFKDALVSKARTVGIDEAWVYGIIRQESRFVTVAKSHVGASGLMQVMPATASYIAKKIGLKEFRDHHIANIDTNLTLGTNYLKMMQDQLDNSPVLASAGYNAGPGRPKMWRKRLGPDRSLEGAIFAELIPFDETRGYVKNVMSNTVAYSLLLKNESIPLKQRLGTISGL